jgi:uncharacterized membrane protein (DUF2068 family)
LDSASKKHRNRWLVLIAAFKAAQALLFIAIGVGALRLLHKDVSDVLEQLAGHLRFNPEGKLVQIVDFLLDKASLVDDKMLRRISAFVFFYAGVNLTEGIGLYLDKAWAEYFTLAITASFLPLEFYELVHKLTWPRVALLIVNILVLAYLVNLIWSRRRQRMGLRSGKSA